MAGREHQVVRATHQYVTDPEVGATLDVWARMLARALRNQKPVGEPPDVHLPAEPGKEARPTR